MASEKGQVISCHTVDRWNELLQEGNESKKLVVVQFATKFRGPYRRVGSILDPMARIKPDVIFVRIDVDELKFVAEDWAVEAVETTPTFLFIKEGKMVDRIEGTLRYKVWSAAGKHSWPTTVTPAA